MRINTYLGFNGDCREAFEFYARILGGKIHEMMTFAGTPAEEHIPPDSHAKIMHASLVVSSAAGDFALLGADSLQEHYEPPQGLWVSLSLDSVQKAERVFHALAEGGQVSMPLGETFWAARFGIVTDRFGTPWMISCDRHAS